MKRRYIFVHVPKNAGNSIYSTYCDLTEIWDHNLRVESYKTYPNSDTFKQIRNKSLIFGKKRICSFAVIRNPWDRVYSAYNFLSKGGLKKEDKLDFKKYIEPYSDFNHFVLEGLSTASKEQIHFLPQLHWIANSKGKIIVDEILRFENLSEDLNNFWTRRGYPPRSLSFNNKKNSKGYRNFYSAESIEIVKKIYAPIITKFNYQF